MVLQVMVATLMSNSGTMAPVENSVVFSLEYKCHLVLTFNIVLYVKYEYIVCVAAFLTYLLRTFRVSKIITCNTKIILELYVIYFNSQLKAYNVDKKEHGSF
jgi:hypothetical protein